MSIFDIIAEILFNKKTKKITNIDTETYFSPFMVNRWISMYSNQLALKSNLLNKFLMFNKTHLYSLFVNVFDKVPNRKISYFKRNNETKKEDNVEILMAQSHEISLREIKMYKHILNSQKNL